MVFYCATTATGGQPPAKVFKTFLIFYLSILVICPTAVYCQKILFSNKMIPIHCSREIASDKVVERNIRQLIRLISIHSKNTDNEEIGDAIVNGLEARLELFLKECKDLIYIDSENRDKKSLDFLSSALKFLIGTPSSSDWVAQMEINSHLLNLQKTNGRRIQGMKNTIRND